MPAFSFQRIFSEEKSGGSYDYLQIKLSVACFLGVFFFFCIWVKWPFYEQFSSAKPNKAQGPGALQTSCSAGAKKKKKTNPYSRYGLFQPLNPNPPQGKRSLCKLLTFVAVHWLLLKTKKNPTNSFIVGIFVGPDNSCLLPWQWIPQHSPCNVTNHPPPHPHRAAKFLW